MKQVRPTIFILGLILFFLFPKLESQASLELPKNLNSAERKTAVEILGLSSTSKILGNPYPLGGYSGVEIGLTTEVITTSELGRLGNKPDGQSETSFSTLTFGKGLYNNIDIYVQFTPFTQVEKISNFGGQFRWGFYQAEYLPAHLSLIVFGNNTNFENKINTVSQGTDLVAGFTVRDVTFYTGIGAVRSIGTFVGGSEGVTAPDPGSGTTLAPTATEDIRESHYLAGINLKFSQFFIAVQMDRYSQATYSGKLGLRF